MLVKVYNGETERVENDRDEIQGILGRLGMQGMAVVVQDATHRGDLFVILD
jgi:hypothetical protein